MAFGSSIFAKYIGHRGLSVHWTDRPDNLTADVLRSKVKVKVTTFVKIT